ncbi:MAG: hypothetical protein ACF8PN_04235 [Phycisphaerales bacterium]
MLRRFIALSAGLAVCGLTTASFAAPKTLQKASMKEKLQPVSIAPLYADGTVGEWRPYVGVDDTVNLGGEFDSYEGVKTTDPCGSGKGFPTDGVVNGGFDPFCDIASVGGCAAQSYRWFFGSTYVSGGRRSGGNSATNSTGTANRLQLGWWNTLNPGQRDPNGNTVGDTVIVVSTYDANFDQFCGTGDPNFLTGVILNFGSVGAGGYYYTDVDLTGGFELTVPTGGASVGVEIQFFYDTGLSTVGANNQVMLWGPKDPADQGVGEPIVYDDDNWDGTFDPFTECFDYTFGLCPDPLGNMVGLFGEGGGGNCVTFTVPTLVAGSPATFRIADGQANANYAIAYYPTQRAADTACDCADPLSASAGNFVRCNGGTDNLVDNDGNPGNNRLNSSGAASLTVPVPNSARGRTLWFVAYTPDGDGTFCCVVSGPHTVL